jgi:hypothetical protein
LSNSFIAIMAVKIALEGSDGTRWLALLMSSGGEQER